MALNWQFDASQYNPNGFELVPEGRHKVSVSDIKTQFSQKSGFQQIVITFTVSGSNGFLRDMMTLFPPNHMYYRTSVRSVGNFCECFGINPQDFVSNEQIALNRVGFVDVSHKKNDNGKVFANIDKYIFRSDIMPQGDMSNINPNPIDFNNNGSAFEQQSNINNTAGAQYGF